MSVIQYQRVVNSVVTNQWLSTYAGANYTEPGWGNSAAATYSGTPAGSDGPIVITANTAGIAGNISLTLDGTSTLATLIANWNTANLSNQVTLTSGDGTQTLPAGSLALSGGQNLPYTVVATDITAQLSNEAAVAKGLQCQQFGATVVAQVYAYNEANLQSGALTSGQFNTMLADTTISNIERCLWNGSLNTALALINSYNTTLLTYFSSGQLSTITSMISNSGLL
jgi:hypothetical protein